MGASCALRYLTPGPAILLLEPQQRFHRLGAGEVIPREVLCECRRKRAVVRLIHYQAWQLSDALTYLTVLAPPQEVRC